MMDRFWLIVHEPGLVPVRKGPWKRTIAATVLREFIAAKPTAYLHFLSVDSFGDPVVDHGPEVLQMLDGRSMSVGSKHNVRTLDAHTLAAENARLREQVEALREDSEKLTPAQLDAVCSALAFVTAGDWDASSHDHRIEVYERAHEKLARMSARVRVIVPSETNEHSCHECGGQGGVGQPDRGGRYRVCPRCGGDGVEPKAIAVATPDAQQTGNGEGGR